MRQTCGVAGRNQSHARHAEADACQNSTVSIAALARAWLLAMLAACNQFYDIPETDLVEMEDQEDLDSDDDGVLDIIDVCPTVANPTQADQDSDRIGDACDECPTGSNHNEDGDLWLDGCDNCPNTANDDQINADGDDLGDLCDDSSTLQRRNRFDGFATLGNDWIPGTVEWSATGGHVMPTETPGSFDFGIWNRHVEVNGPAWRIETGIALDPVPDSFAGIQTHRSVGTPEYLCYVLYSSSGWTLNTEGATLSIPAPPNPLRLQLISTDGDIICALTGGSRITATAPVTPRTHPGLRTNVVGPKFLYVDTASTIP